MIFQHDPGGGGAADHAAAGGRAWEVLRQSCEAVLASRGQAPRAADVERLTATAWGLVHGLSTLWLDGPMRCAPNGVEVDLDGLGVMAGGMFGELLEAYLERGSEGQAADETAAAGQQDGDDLKV